MSAALSIAIVEDHERVRVSTANFLRKHGHRVFELACAEDMDVVVGGASVDLFILDLNLPGEDGLAFTRRIKSIHPAVGILILTARGSSDHIARGYQEGADIYLVKPVTPEILLGAIESIRRRLPSHQAEVSASFVLNLSALTVSGPLGRVQLNPAEASVLSGLIRSPEHTLDIFQVSEFMGQSEKGFNQASIVVRIVRLRKKLVSVGAERNCIQPQRLQGYRLCLMMQIQ